MTSRGLFQPDLSHDSIMIAYKKGIASHRPQPHTLQGFSVHHPCKFPAGPLLPNTASASVINGTACKEGMILAIWDYVLNTSSRKNKILLGNNCHSWLFQPSKRVLQIVTHCLYIKKLNHTIHILYA